VGRFCVQGFGASNVGHDVGHSVLKPARAAAHRNIHAPGTTTRYPESKATDSTRPAPQIHRKTGSGPWLGERYRNERTFARSLWIIAA
jgi:hypothetical protein